MVKRGDILKKLDKKLEELETEFLEDKAKECIEARDAIIEVLRERGVSLPAAVFALDVVKWELLRGQYEEFIGNVKLTDKLPLKATPS